MSEERKEYEFVLRDSGLPGVYIFDHISQLERPMSDTIEPAMSQRDALFGLEDAVESLQSAFEWCARVGADAGPVAEEAGRAIALANAALPDSDPRKITREKIRILSMALQSWDGVGQDPKALRDWMDADDDRPEPAIEYVGDQEGAVAAFLDALESYLPPEEG